MDSKQGSRKFIFSDPFFISQSFYLTWLGIRSGVRVSKVKIFWISEIYMLLFLLLTPGLKLESGHLLK